MPGTIQKLRQILTRREKLQVLILLFAIIAMAFSQAVGVASVLPFISLVMDPNMVFDNQYLAASARAALSRKQKRIFRKQSRNVLRFVQKKMPLKKTSPAGQTLN